MANENKYLNYQGVQTLWSAVNNKKQNKIFSGTGAPSATTAPNAVDGDVYLDLSGGVSVNNTSSALVDLIYPVGSIYQTVNSNFDPNSSFGGIWEQLEGVFLLGSDDNHAIGTSGGVENVTLTANQCGVPQHKHPDACFYGMRRSTAATSGGSNNFLVAGDNTTYYSSTESELGEATTAAVTALTLNTSFKRPKMKIKTEYNSTANAAEAHTNMPPYLTINIWKRIA